jgi:hypothetical protein
MTPRIVSACVRLTVFALPLIWLALVVAEAGWQAYDLDLPDGIVIWRSLTGVTIGYVAGLLAGPAAREGRSTLPAFLGMGLAASLNSWWFTALVVGLNTWADDPGIERQIGFAAGLSWVLAFAAFLVTTAVTRRLPVSTRAVTALAVVSVTVGFASAIVFSGYPLLGLPSEIDAWRIYTFAIPWVPALLLASVGLRSAFRGAHDEQITGAFLPLAAAASYEGMVLFGPSGAQPAGSLGGFGLWIAPTLVFLAMVAFDRIATNAVQRSAVRLDLKRGAAADPSAGSSWLRRTP